MITIYKKAFIIKKMNKEDENKSKYETFILSLKQKISIDEESLAKYQKNIKQKEQLEDYIRTQIELNKCLEKKAKFNIDNEIFVEGRYCKTNTIIINIGLDVFIEIDNERALHIIKKQKEILLRKRELLLKEIIKNKAYLKLTKDLSNQLSNHETMNKNIINKTKNINSITI